MRQFAGFGSAKDTNERFKYLLAHGTDGLSTAFDMPTLMGYDADSDRALGEVGREGVSVSTVEDMETLFGGIRLDEVTTSMTVNCSASILLAMYFVVAERQGCKLKDLGGTIQNDMLKEFIAQKEWICPPEPSLRIVTDMIEFCTREAPRWHAVSISGYHIREAGSTAVQEVAFTLADGVAYVEAAVARGLDVDAFAPQLSFFFNAHNNFLEEVAKYRAARRLWARLMRERFGAKNPKSHVLRFHTQTAGSTLTAQQPDVNVVRVTLQALAAVLGGTQSLHTNSRDEALGLPTSEAALLALRTQQVIAHESGVADTADPLAGAYAVEALTAEIESRAVTYLEKIDAMGGMLAAIESGFVQREIQDAAYDYQRAVEKGEQVVVGVNRFAVDDEPSTPVLVVDPQSERAQVERLRAVRASRDAARAEAATSRVGEVARGSDNLVPAILDAVEAYATVGEISDALRAVFGEYEEAVTV
jgi:methylmalonyl-CoA mutase N-terminal domain/subunit